MATAPNAALIIATPPITDTAVAIYTPVAKEAGKTIQYTVPTSLSLHVMLLMRAIEIE